MARYYLHLREFGGEISEDEEGSELPNLAAARNHAMLAMQEILSFAIKRGEDAGLEAILIADEQGKHLAAVPVAAPLPPTIVKVLKAPAEVVAPNRFEEYRRNADGCRAMAENAADPDDKMSWLKLADAWLQMLPKQTPATNLASAGWPDPSDEDSKASH
jgi:hypothetical protein